MTNGQCALTVQREFRTQEGFIFYYRIAYSMNQLKCSTLALIFLLTSLPTAGLFQENLESDFNYENYTTEIPEQIISHRSSLPWWETWSKGVHFYASLSTRWDVVGVGSSNSEYGGRDIQVPMGIM